MDKGVVHKLRITDKTIGIKEISIEVHNKVYNVTVSVVKLAGQPATVTHSVSGNVYQWMEITHDNLTDSNVKSAKIRFNISRSWLINNSFSSSDVALQRYNNGWSKITVTKVSESTNDFEYQADVPGLSVFTITAERSATAPAIACGNNMREGAEECDGSDLAGQNCVSKGFTGGTLKCSSCLFDVSGCIAPTGTGGPVCGNSACEAGEDVTSCPEDCKSFELPNITIGYGWLMTIIVIIIVGIAGWFYYHGHKHVRRLVYKYQK